MELSKRKLLMDIEKVLFLFFVIYRPAIIPGINISDVTLVWALVGYVMKNRMKLHKGDFINGKQETILVIVLLAAVVYSSVVVSLNGGRLLYGMLYVKMFFYPLIYSAYIKTSIDDRNPLYTVLNWIGVATLIQTCFVLAMLVNPGLKNSIITVLINNGATGITADRFSVYGQRSFGLADGYFSGLSIVSGLLAAIYLYTGIEYRKVHWVFIPGLLLTAAVNARTGLVIFLVGAIFIVACSPRISINQKGKIFFGFFMLFGIAIIGVRFLEKYSPGTVSWLLSSSEHISMTLSDSETTYTYYKLNPLNWQLPDGVSTIFGTGKSIFGSEGLQNFGISSDSGYLGIIYRGGLILSLLLYIFIVRLCVDRQYNLIESASTIGKLCLLTLVIQQYKGGVFYFNEYTTLIVLLMMIISKMSKQKQEDEYAYNKRCYVNI